MNGIVESQEKRKKRRRRKKKISYFRTKNLRLQEEEGEGRREVQIVSGTMESHEKRKMRRKKGHILLYE